MARSAAAIGDLLPSVDFPRADGSGEVGWRDVSHTTAAVFPHGAACAGCRAYLGGLDPDGRLSNWGGRLITVLAASTTGERLGAAGGEVVRDPAGRGREVLGLERGTAAVVVVDRFGQLFARWSDPAGHDLPTASTLLEEVRFVGVQCPECEVPDLPTGAGPADGAVYPAGH